MAGVYSDLIKELIAQSNVNRKLVRTVNYIMSKQSDAEYVRKDMPSFKALRDIHIGCVNAEYAPFDLAPVYNYFDGTQLINSLFSQIVVPIEFLKSQGRSRELIERKLQFADSNSYLSCRERIPNLILVNTYENENPACARFHEPVVYNFFIHIRNALCHSGGGKLFFFPQGSERDITDIYFYDTDEKNALFFAKVGLNILFDIVNEFDKMIVSLAKTNDSVCDLNKLVKDINDKTGANITLN